MKNSEEPAEEAPAEEAESAGKFASAADPEADLPEAVQSAPEETQQQYQAVAAKGNSLKQRALRPRGTTGTGSARGNNE